MIRVRLLFDLPGVADLLYFGSQADSRPVYGISKTLDSE